MTKSNDPWLPARVTPALSENFTTEWDRFGPIIVAAWAMLDIELDEWQVWLLRRVMETYPPGHPRAGELRFRQVLISVGRQNGKTEIAAALALWGLLRRKAGLTVGIASNTEQATLVYDRVRAVIGTNPELADLFRRVTGTRGLELHNGASYVTKAAKSAALQGLPIHTGIIDEVHIVEPELWADLVNGTGARANAIVIGITTAGGDHSALLKDLYATADKAIAGEAERFGAFIWESPEATVPDDDAALIEALKPANPRLASGKIDPEIFLADVRTTPGGKAGIVRYRLNRFTSGTEAFIDLALWARVQREYGDEWPAGRPVFALDWSEGQTYASIAAAILVDGVVYTEIAAQITNPTLEGLVAECERLAEHWPLGFVMYSYTLRELGNELKRRGYPVSLFTPADVVRASNSFYARVMRGTLKHAGDPVLTVQLPRTVRKPHGDSFIISHAESSIEIDAVKATLMAVHAAEVIPETQIHVY